MTFQEMFDISAKHILAQGKPSMASSEGGCMYRTPDGLKCAFGPFIPDDKYSPGLEGLKAFEVIRQLGLNLDTSFSTRLQKCHDDSSIYSAFISDYVRRMRILAKNYDLDASILGDDELS
jgi:hypothetical protein